MMRRCQRQETESSATPSLPTYIHAIVGAFSSMNDHESERARDYRVCIKDCPPFDKTEL